MNSSNEAVNLKKLIEYLIKHLGLILSSFSTIGMFFYRSVYWLILVIMGVLINIVQDSIKGHKEVAKFIENLISKRDGEFRENILNNSELSSIFYVNAPYRFVQNYKEKLLPPCIKLWEKYWGERHRRSELQYRVKFEYNFEDAKNKQDKNELEMCFYRLCKEINHYYVTLCIFSEQFLDYKNNGEIKNWFFEVIDNYNSFISKLEDDARELQIKLPKEKIETNLTTYNKKDWE